MSTIAQQSLPKLGVTLALLALMYYFVGWQVLRGFRQRVARGRIERGDETLAEKRPRRIAWRWGLVGVAVVAFTVYREFHPPSNFDRQTQSWWPVAVPVGLIGLLAVGIGALYLNVHFANRVIREARKLKEAGDLPAALELLRHVRARHDPKKSPTRYASATLGLSTLLAESGDHEGAETVLREGAAQFPGDGTWTMAVAIAVANAGRRDEAIALLATARQQTPREAMIRVVSASQLAAAGRIEEAADYLRQAEEMLVAYPDEQRSPAKNVRESIAALRARVGESPRAFEVVVPPAQEPA